MPFLLVKKAGRNRIKFKFLIFPVTFLEIRINGYKWILYSMVEFASISEYDFIKSS